MGNSGAAKWGKELLPARLRQGLETAYSRCRYCRYFVIGGIIGVSAVLVLELFSLLFPDTVFFYALSVSLVYAGGIIAGYYSHSRITFNSHSSRGGTLKALIVFASIAGVGLVTTTMLATFFRYGLPLQVVAGRFANAVAFILAALIASVITYYLNARYTFTASDNSGDDDDSSSS